MPVVVLTKADLCDDLEQKMIEVSEVAAGVDIVIVSSKNDDFEGVYEYLTPGKTVAFIGSSGVGKSTLINKLLGEELFRTSEIREDDDKGRHTTTHRELVALPNGAFVIDTPGMRTLGLWNNEEGASVVFSDIEELACACRFSNCSHTNEPGCAILEALANGGLSEERWKSYQKLQIENAYTANEGEYLKAKKEKFKAIAKMNKKRLGT